MTVLTSAHRCAVGAGLAATVALVAACGGGTDAATTAATTTAPTTAAPTSATSTTAAPTTTAVPTTTASTAGPTTSAPATGGGEKGVLSRAARATIEGGSVKVAIVNRTTLAGGTTTTTTNSTQDFRHHTAALVLSGSTGRSEARIIGDTIYIRTAGTGASTPWSKVDVKTTGVFTTLDPSVSLGYLDAAVSGLKELGAASIGGVATTHYSATVDVVKALGPTATGATGTLLRKAGVSAAHLDAYLDGQGRYRRLSQTYTAKAFPAAGGGTGPATFASTQDYTDYGVSVTVTAPPASQVTKVGG